jgi:hypothetical protein
MSQLNSTDVVKAVEALPPSLAELLKKMPGLVVAGGFLRALVASEEVRDVDIFARSPELANQAAVFYASRTSTSVYRSKSAYTVEKVQFVHRWVFPNPERLLDNFDFVACKAALWHDEGWKSLADPRFYGDVAARRLTYTSPAREEGAADAVLRLLKFYRMGYRATRRSLAEVLNRFIDLSAKEIELMYLDSDFIEKLLAEVDRGSDEDGKVYL